MSTFGPFRYDRAQRLLFRDGQLVPLAPKAIDTLEVLLDRRGAVVEKGELMRLVWPDTTVEEIGLARNISLLRKALEADGAEYIETIPKRGYRFLAAEVAPAKRRWLKWVWLAAGAAAVGALIYWQFYLPSKFVVSYPGEPSLAVVPFEPPGTESQSFSGLLVTALARQGGVTIVGPSTVERHRRAGNSMAMMGRMLGLDVLVEGTLEQTATDVRVSPRLVDVRTGRLIWAESRTYAASDWQHAKDAAANQIAAQLAAHLSIRAKSM